VQRSATLDGVRGIAIALVVGFHTLGTFAPKTLHPLLWPLAGGTLGVDLFFVLSGYLLVRSWESNRSVGRFWGRRARRVLPAYWLSLAVLVPLLAPELLHHAGRLALFVTMQPFLAPRLPWAVNASYWSLTPEIHFYLLLPVLYALLTKLGTRRTLLIVFALSIVWRIATTSHYHFPADMLPGRLDQFAVGMAAATAGERARAFATRRSALLAGGALAVLLSGYGWTFWRTGGDPPHVIEALAHPVIGLLIGVAFLRLRHVGRVRLLEAKPVAALGAVSYSLYLWHLPVVMLVRRLGRTGWFVLLAVTAALLVATVSYFVIERPLMRRAARAPREGAEPPPSLEPQPSAALT
jgi:peptidoglycan/LPS O-acetylase OafA/YrhL